MKKEFTIIHKTSLQEISKIIEASKGIWHNTSNGKLIEIMTEEEVYQLLYCSNKANFYISGYPL